MLHRFAAGLIPLASLACLASLVPASAQSATFQVITPAGWSAVDIADNGEHVVGVVGSNGFLWNAVGGFQILSPGEAWAVTPDGSIVAGTTASAAIKREAAIWTPGTGWVAQGNFGGSPGCDTSVSNFDDITPDGQWAAGMSWQVCKTFAARWNASSGFELLAKQSAAASARALCLSDDGQTCAGWETVGGPRAAAVWLPNGTEIFPLVSPSNTLGIGEIHAMSGDASVMCGVTQTFAFVRTQAGVQLLPKIASVPGTYTAYDVSADGTIAVGAATSGPTSTAWIWTAAHGTQTMLSYLQAKGVPGLSSVLFGACTGLSDDGLSICGWGNTGGWVAYVDSPWTDLGQGLAGAGGVPSLDGSGTLQPGGSVQLALTSAAAAAPATLVAGFTQIAAPFKGGVLVPNADVLLIGFVTNGSGEILIPTGWPLGVPSAFNIYFQWWIADAGGPKGFAASNGLRGTTP